jgi:hypothetical protein
LKSIDGEYIKEQWRMVEEELERYKEEERKELERIARRKEEKKQRELRKKRLERKKQKEEKKKQLQEVNLTSVTQFIQLCRH